MHTATTFINWIRPSDLTRPTPCTEWDLAALLAHMVGQNRGFAVAARTGRASTHDHLPELFTPDRWVDSAYDLVAAFAEADPDSGILEPELHPTRPLSLSTVVGAHLLDTVVHTWDVARSLELLYLPTHDIAVAVMDVASTVPDGPSRRRPSSPFAPPVRTPGPQSPWARTLAYLGRDASAPRDPRSEPH